MQLEFLELSPHLSIQNEQIMAGWISLLSCLRNRSNWPLKSFPRRDWCGGGRSEQMDCHSPGESECKLSGIPESRWVHSVYLHCTLGLFILLESLQSGPSVLGSSGEIWGYGNLFTSSRSVNHCIFRCLESALQAYYYTEVVSVNSDCHLR